MNLCAQHAFQGEETLCFPFFWMVQAMFLSCPWWHANQNCCPFFFKSIKTFLILLHTPADARPPSSANLLTRKVTGASKETHIILVLVSAASMEQCKYFDMIISVWLVMLLKDAITGVIWGAITRAGDSMLLCALIDTMTTVASHSMFGLVRNFALLVRDLFSTKVSVTHPQTIPFQW